jgi:hypothetical protein
MEKELLSKLGFSKEFIEHIQQYPKLPFYEQTFSDVSSVRIVRQIKGDLIIDNPGVNFNDLRLQHFRSTVNVI